MYVYIYILNTYIYMYISLPPSLLEHIDITRLFQGATKTKHCEIWLLFPGSAAGAALKCVCVYIYMIVLRKERI